MLGPAISTRRGDHTLLHQYSDSRDPKGVGCTNTKRSGAKLHAFQMENDLHRCATYLIACPSRGLLYYSMGFKVPTVGGFRSQVNTRCNQVVTFWVVRGTFLSPTLKITNMRLPHGDFRREEFPMRLPHMEYRVYR